MKNNRTNEIYFLKAQRYFKNAKEFLKKSPIEYWIYKDEKLVREACGIGYLAVLEAINSFLLQMGYPRDKLPKSYDGYSELLRKYAQRNGKVMVAFKVVYQNLHIAGYYREGVDVKMIKSGFEKAKFIIEHLSGKKLT